MNDRRPHPATEALLAFFPASTCAVLAGGVDLPAEFTALAVALAAQSRGPEGTVALRKLLESMDAARRDNPDAFAGAVQMPPAAPLPASPPDDGLEAAPARYTAEGRETVDRVRDQMRALARAIAVPGLTIEEMGDLLFLAWCAGSETRYLDRLGLKAGQTADRDRAAAAWFGAMADHAWSRFQPTAPPSPDPRESRVAGFEPYKEQVWTGQVGRRRHPWER